MKFRKIMQFQNWTTKQNEKSMKVLNSVIAEFKNRIVLLILNGHYTVLDFIFTNCPIYCPSMAVVMQRVQDATAGSDARLLSISVDGEHDTPEVLDAYADAIDADRSRWSFLTGDPGAVHALCEEQLLLGISVDSSRQVAVRDGSEMDFIDHPTRLILVGPDRQVLGMYSYQDPGAIDALIARLRALTD